MNQSAQPRWIAFLSALAGVALCFRLRAEPRNVISAPGLLDAGVPPLSEPAEATPQHVRIPPRTRAAASVRSASRAAHSAVEQAAPPEPVPAEPEEDEAQWAEEPVEEPGVRASLEAALLTRFGLKTSSVLDVDCRVSLCRLDAILPTAPSETPTPDQPHPERDVTTMYFPTSELTNETNEVQHDEQE